jgi:hypothetical protein
MERVKAAFLDDPPRAIVFVSESVGVVVLGQVSAFGLVGTAHALELTWLANDTQFWIDPAWSKADLSSYNDRVSPYKPWHCYPEVVVHGSSLYKQCYLTLSAATFKEAACPLPAKPILPSTSSLPNPNCSDWLSYIPMALPRACMLFVGNNPNESSEDKLVLHANTGILFWKLLAECVCQQFPCMRNGATCLVLVAICCRHLREVGDSRVIGKKALLGCATAPVVERMKVPLRAGPPIAFVQISRSFAAALNCVKSGNLNFGLAGTPHILALLWIGEDTRIWIVPSDASVA